MNLLSLAGSVLALAAVLVVGGLAIEGPVQTALANATGPERGLFLVVEVWPKLVHLILGLLGD